MDTAALFKINNRTWLNNSNQNEHSAKNDHQVDAFCDRLEEFLMGQDKINGRVKAALILDFEHNLSIIGRLPDDTISQKCHERLTVLIEKFQETNTYN